MEMGLTVVTMAIVCCGSNQGNTNYTNFMHMHKQFDVIVAKDLRSN